jgi:cytochrome o ubiquinol oxidase operon protein cyoD
MDHSLPGHGHAHTPAGAGHGSFGTYAVGFVLSVILTAAAFWVVMAHVMSPGGTVTAIAILAAVQVMVHLVCFLHLNFSSEQRWNVTAFAFAVLVVGVVIIGSLWIIHNMTERMMPQMQHMPSLQQQP